MASAYGNVRVATGDGLRYTNVAIALHWAIAALILYNLTSGLLKPLLPGSFFMFHVSSGITILALTVVRIAWRLTHRPPPMLPMQGWERRLAHGVHLLFYAAMLVMPLSGWALVSANPPANSPGAAWAKEHRPGPPSAGPGEAPRGGPAGAGAGGGAGGGAPPRPRGPAMIWGLFKLPLIAPINDLGRTAAGVPAQRELHERIEAAHLLGGWTMLALLILHVAGALKHQYVDRERELARMGLGRSRAAVA